MANADGKWECVECNQKSGFNCVGCKAELCYEQACVDSHTTKCPKSNFKKLWGLPVPTKGGEKHD
jgi:hypothetical protein